MPDHNDGRRARLDVLLAEQPAVQRRDARDL
jgi:hypothetical protein